MNPQQASPADLLAIQRSYGNRAVQRMLAEAEPAAVPVEQHSPATRVARTSGPASMAGGALDSRSASEIDAARGGGSALDTGAGEQFGAALGADFSGVKVHTDTRADALNRSLSARAFTTGSDIFFSEGAYQPGTSGGKELIAHELTHVVQQGSAKPNKLQAKRSTGPGGHAAASKPNKLQTKLTVGAAGDRYEQEADTVAKQLTSAGSQHLARRLMRAVQTEPCGCASCHAQSIQRELAPIRQPVVQRVREKMKTDSPLLVVNVDPGLLSKGAQLLKSMVRPPVVNDATADKLSNCALTTMAAIEGGKTSGEFAQGVRTREGVGGPASTEQSQKLWAITLADKATLGTLASGQLLTDEHHLSNKELIKNMEDFAEGNAYVVGDAQYYGMLQHLLTNAKQDSTGAVQFKVYEYGEPGNAMFPEAALVSTMQGYPEGTRFGVFVHSTDASQHVRAHWIYAENFGGNIIFKDFQTNVSKTTGFGPKKTTAPVPVDNFLNQFPFSPDVAKDKGKSFEDGAFIAYVPIFTGDPPKVIAGKEVNADTVVSTIAGVKTKMAQLREPIQKPGEKFSPDWSARMGSDVTEIPAPSVIEAGVRSVASVFGVSPTCSLTGGSLTAPGMIKIIGNPIHSSGKVGKSVKGTLTQVSTDKLTFQNLSNTIKVVKPGLPGAQDASELPVTGGAPDVEPEYRQAFSKAYQIQAQAGTEGISLNANWMEFTDLIHEATHSFEGGTMEMHMREGLTDLFASMVAQQVQSSSGDARWEYKYNPSYAPYVVGMQDLAKLVGLPTLAKLYFQAPDHAAFLKNAITTQAGTPGADVTELVNGLLDFSGFPANFNVKLGELKGILTGHAPAQTGPEAKFKTDVYDPREAKFGNYLTEEATRLGSKYGKDLASGDETSRAAGVETWSNTETAEKRLKILYNHKEAATGQQFVQLMALIGGHESAISNATGESVEALRMRLVPMHKDFIVDSFWSALETLGNGTNLEPLNPFFVPKSGLLKSQVGAITAGPKWKQMRFKVINSKEDVRRKEKLPRPDTLEHIERNFAILKVRGRP